MNKRFIFSFILIGLVAITIFSLITTGTEVGSPGYDVRAAEDDELEEDKPVKKINYYLLIYYAHEKNTEYDPGKKERPEPEEPVVEAPTPPPASSTETSSAAPAPSGSSSFASQKEQQMLNLINDARASAGLAPLKLNEKMTQAARAKSKDMADNNYFTHHSPTYGSFSSLLQRFGVSYRAAAENIAMNSNGSVSAAHGSLMNSAGHRANILNSSFSHVGVGIHVRSDGYHYYTQLFIGN